MLENAKSVTSDSDDDLYSGYNEYPAAFSIKDLEKDEVLQGALRTSYGKRLIVSKPGTAMRLATAPGLSKPGTALRLPTAAGVSKPGTALRLTSAAGLREGTATGFRPVTGTNDGIVRPVTVLKGVGYTSQRPATVFDPLSRGSKMQAQGDPKREESPEEKIKKVERRIMEMIEEGCLANSHGDHRSALEKAIEASSKQTSLIRMQEQAGLSEAHNLDLTFSVLFNLANQYDINEMYSEALNTYQVITQKRMFNNANQLKVNMGNIYFKLGQYPRAVKMYRMTLDQVPNTHRDFRIKIMHNIGIVFVKMGQYSDACSTFEYIMQEKPEFTTGLNLILCHYALGDKDKMKRGFQMLLEIPLNIDDNKYARTNDDPVSNIILEVIKNDPLAKIERQMKEEAERCILTAAKVISPVIEGSYSAGYDWCVYAIKASIYSHLANDLEINKAVMFLREGEYTQTIDILKSFEKKPTKLASIAATNLSFIHFLQGDIDKAEKYADQARDADSYNSCAIVNLGNCCLAKGDLEKAKELFVSALDNDASCVEALYNLGLVNKRKGLHQEAVECFFKLQSITKHQPQVLYQLAHLHELLGDVDQAKEWYLQLIGVLPSDPGVLQRMGEIFENEEDKQQAFQYYHDSYRYYPSNFEVLDWLGSYFIEMKMPEKAIVYFERAALMDPADVKWRLMIASCHRRSGNYHHALSTYKAIHNNFPENVECLKFLLRICGDLGLGEAAEYAKRLRKVEAAKEARDRIGSCRPGTRFSARALSSHGGPSLASEVVSLGRISSGTPSMKSTSSWGVHGRISVLDDPEFSPPIRKEVVLGYVDPLGPLAERPRTSAGPKPPEDDFGDEELGDDLLPV